MQAKSADAARAKAQHDALEAEFLVLRDSVEQRRRTDDVELAQMRDTIVSLERLGADSASSVVRDAAAAVAETAAAKTAAVASASRSGAIAVAALYDDYNSRVAALRASADAELERESTETARSMQAQLDAVLASLDAQLKQNMRRADALRGQLAEVVPRIAAARARVASGLQAAGGGAASATARQPVPVPAASEADLRRLKRAVRVLWQEADAASGARRASAATTAQRIAFLSRVVHAAGPCDAVIEALKDHLDALQARERRAQRAAGARRAASSSRRLPPSYVFSSPDIGMPTTEAPTSEGIFASSRPRTLASGGTAHATAAPRSSSALHQKRAGGDSTDHLTGGFTVASTIHLARLEARTAL